MHIKNIIPYVVIAIFSFIVSSSFGYRFSLVDVSVLCFLIIAVSAMRSVYILTIVIISISAMVYYPVSVLYGDINFNTIASVLFSNKDESLGFMKAIPMRLYMVSLIIFILSVIVMKIKFSLPAKIKAIFLLFGVVILSSPILYAYSEKGRITSIDIKNPIARFFITLPVRYMEVMHEIKLMKEYSQNIKYLSWLLVKA